MNTIEQWKKIITINMEIELQITNWDDLKTFALSRENTC